MRAEERPEPRMGRGSNILDIEWVCSLGRGWVSVVSVERREGKGSVVMGVVSLPRSSSCWLGFRDFD